MKYEIKIIECTKSEADEKLQEYQNDGWLLAGDISIASNRDNHCLDKCVNIPLKKEIK